MVKIDPFLQSKRDELLALAETYIKAKAYEVCTHFMNRGEKLNEYIYDHVRMTNSSEVEFVGKARAKEICDGIALWIQNIPTPTITPQEEN